MASGDTLAVWGPTAATPPATLYATLDVRNGHVVLDFDASAEESAIFGGVFPRNYGGGNFEVDLIWAATIATSGNVKWNVAAENTTDADLDADGFGAAATAASPTAAASGALTKTTMSFSTASVGSPAADEAFRLKVTRDADDAADTLTGDAELWAVHLREA
jgi:hypothetical protein